MNIHEYQGKQIFARYGIPVPKGIPAFSAAEAKAAAEKLITETGSPVVVVKAQIHAGGRGKGGGVKVAKGGREDAKTPRRKYPRHARSSPLRPAPRAEGLVRLYVEQGVDIAREFYSRDARRPRGQRRVCFIASHRGRHGHRGGRRTQTPRRSSPWMSTRLLGFMPYQARKHRVSARPHWRRRRTTQFVKFAQKHLRDASSRRTARCSRSTPLLVTKQGRRSGARRQDQLRRQRPSATRSRSQELRDPSEEDPLELEAEERGPQLRRRSTATSAAW
jgi:succinyl-CoA synthetase beta subunit